MLNDAAGIENIYIACGYTDLRYGIDGLSTLVRNKFDLDPFQTNTLFLFCGRKKDRLKGLELYRHRNNSRIFNRFLLLLQNTNSAFANGSREKFSCTRLKSPLMLFLISVPPQHR